MAELLLDTSRYIDTLRARKFPQEAWARNTLANALAEENAGPFSISAFSIYELRIGAQRNRVPGARSPDMGFLKRLQVVYPREEFELAATITAKLADLRMSIGVIDELIATTAISGTYTLVTATRHFERVREAGFDFKLANWRLAR